MNTRLSALWMNLGCWAVLLVVGCSSSNSPTEPASSPPDSAAQPSSTGPANSSDSQQIASDTSAKEPENAQEFIPYEVALGYRNEKRTVVFYGPPGCEFNNFSRMLLKPNEFAVSLVSGHVDLDAKLQQVQGSGDFLGVVESTPDTLAYKISDYSGKKIYIHFYVNSVSNGEEFTLTNTEGPLGYLSAVPNSEEQLHRVLAAARRAELLPIAAELDESSVPKIEPGKPLSESQRWASLDRTIVAKRVADNLVWSKDSSAFWFESFGKIYRCEIATKSVYVINSKHLHALAASPDGEWIAAGCDDGTLCLRRGKDLVKLRETKLPAQIDSLDVDAQGERIAAGLKTGEVVVINVADLKTLATFSMGVQQIVHWVDFSPDSSRLLASIGKQMRIWDIQTGEIEKEFPKSDAPVDDDRFYRLPLFMPNGMSMALVTASETLIESLETGEIERHLGKNTDSFAHVVVSRDGKLAAVASDSEIVVWDLDKSEPLRRLEGLEFFRSLAISPDGTMLAASGNIGSVELIRWWPIELLRDSSQDLSHGEEFASTKLASSPFADMRFSPDGAMLAYAAGVNGEGKVYLLDAMSLEELDSNDGGDRVRFTRDGKQLASLSTVVHFWNIENGRLVPEHFTQAGVGDEFELFDRGRILSCSSSAQDLRFQDDQSGEVLQKFSGHEGGITGMAATPDSSWAATWSSQDKTVRLWDLKSGEAGKIVLQDAAVVSSMAMSPRGEFLAVSDYRLGTRIYKVPECEELHDFSKAARSVDGLAFSPDAKLLAFGERERVRLWDVQTGQEIATLRGHVSSIVATAFSPNGQTIATASNHGSVKLWNVSKYVPNE